MLGVPVLVAFGGGTAPSTAPTLDWNDVPGALTYTLEYADNAAFTVNAVTVTGISVSQFTFATPPPDGTFFWHVKSVDGSIESVFSTADSFVKIPTFTQTAVILLALAMAAYVVWRLR